MFSTFIFFFPPSFLCASPAFGSKTFLWMICGLCPLRRKRSWTLGSPACVSPRSVIILTAFSSVFSFNRYYKWSHVSNWWFCIVKLIHNSFFFFPNSLGRSCVRTTKRRCAKWIVSWRCVSKCHKLCVSFTFIRSVRIFLSKLFLHTRTCIVKESF